MADDDEYQDHPLSLQDLGIKSHRVWGIPVIRVVDRDNGQQKHRNPFTKLNDWWIR